MRPFTFVQAPDEAGAVLACKDQETRYIAGGTTLLDLMRLDVMHPNKLVDVTTLPLRTIEATDKGVRIGALVSNADLARHPAIVKGYPVLSEALLSGASPQLRNMATVGGNLLQRTRCSYFRDPAHHCNKRAPGTGCAALTGYTRMHAVLGGSPSCIATHPSDMCVALAALDAMITARDEAGKTRDIPITDFHTLPGDHPEVESVLKPGELITQVTIPASGFAARSHYVKARDRASYAFALASAAVAIRLDGATIAEARVALGGVGTKPWRSREAEAELTGKPNGLATWKRAADAALAGAQPQKDNAFKVLLAKRTIMKALREVGGHT